MVVGLTPTEQASSASVQDGMQAQSGLPIQALPPDTIASMYPSHLCAM